eukprot:TRINITY_DN3593_c0_g1_i2.p1 TRINITY_DN3593_c0_g1~~TRINITY_DN3593_c0_g1_i2.p1  ORF type:complete len:663 (-),score=158.41 TRINITY_DN3593_c0_g1_i2:78-1823(-)
MMKLSTDAAFVLAALKESTKVHVDDSNTRVKPLIKFERNTIVLRDIPAGTAPEEIAEIFSGKWVIESSHAEIGGNWFVQFDSEAAATAALEHMKGQTFRGAPVRGGIKAENSRIGLLHASRPAVFSAPQGTAPPFAAYPAPAWPGFAYPFDYASGGAAVPGAQPAAAGQPFPPRNFDQKERRTQSSANPRSRSDRPERPERSERRPYPQTSGAQGYRAERETGNTLFSYRPSQTTPPTAPDASAPAATGDAAYSGSGRRFNSGSTGPAAGQRSERSATTRDPAARRGGATTGSRRGQPGASASSPAAGSEEPAAAVAPAPAPAQPSGKALLEAANFPPLPAAPKTASKPKGAEFYRYTKYDIVKLLSSLPAPVMPESLRALAECPIRLETPETTLLTIGVLSEPQPQPEPVAAEPVASTPAPVEASRPAVREDHSWAKAAARPAAATAPATDRRRTAPPPERKSASAAPAPAPTATPADERRPKTAPSKASAPAASPAAAPAAVEASPEPAAAPAPAPAPAVAATKAAAADTISPSLSAATATLIPLAGLSLSEDKKESAGSQSSGEKKSYASILAAAQKK